MPNISYVCLSDLHFGDKNSLLTRLKTDSNDTDPLRPSDVMEQLVECLKSLIKDNNGIKPTLILNGDIFELALNTDNEAIMVFQHFIELAMKKDEEIFNNEQIIFIPGNHDHHLWESSRETQYMEYIKGRSGFLNIPYHTTNMFPKKMVESHLLTQIVQQHDHLKDMIVAAVYPNYGIMREDKQKCIIFHHGHLIEPIYQIMSTLKTWILPDREKPRQVWHIEQENFAWIDFFWSTLGRSGEVGQDVGMIYHKLQSKEEIANLASNIVDGLNRDYNLPGWDRATARVLKWALNFILDRVFKMEKHRTDVPPDKSIEENLKAYMEGPLREQIHIELGRENIPDVTFIFGHTHKPYQKDIKGIKRYNQWVNIYNSGGWVVDTVEPDKNHGGAVILVDEELNAVSVQMYKEDDYSVKVADYPHKNEPPNPLYQHINEILQKDQEPWKTFSLYVKNDVKIRADYLKECIDSASC